MFLVVKPNSSYSLAKVTEYSCVESQDREPSGSLFFSGLFVSAEQSIGSFQSYLLVSVLW